MDINQYFESIKGNKAKLRQFLAAMPKGGDLHNHLTGSSYAELYFYIACEKNLCVHMPTGKLLPKETAVIDNVIRLSHDMSDLHNVRMTLIDKWSIRNFQPYKCALGPDEYFFGEFGLFSEATKDVLPSLLHELILRAQEENVQYLEVMGTSPSVPKTETTCYLSPETYNSVRSAIDAHFPLASDVDAVDDVEEQIKKAVAEYEASYSKQSGIYSAVQSYLAQNKSLIDDSTKEIKNHCFLTSCFDTSVIKEGSVKVKLQGYASRGSADPIAVLAQLYIVHKTMSLADSPVVGCNIVAAENSENSMRYYNAHMLMFKVLREQYSAFNPAPVNPVQTSLHAGELTVGLIRPEHLTYHISNALNVAKADRIGHGVDIPFEHNSFGIVKYMADNRIPVEINLTSNEFILGVKEDAHPVSVYLDNNVPLVLSTDDPGILRTSLTEEYAIAVDRYNLSFDKVVELAENSINYSFLSKDDKDAQLKEFDNRMNAFKSQFEIERVNEVVLYGFETCKKIQWTVSSQCQYKFDISLSQEKASGTFDTLMTAKKDDANTNYHVIGSDAKDINSVSSMKLSISNPADPSCKYKVISKRNEIRYYGDKKCISYSIFVEDAGDNDFNDIYVDIVGWEYVN